MRLRAQPLPMAVDVHLSDDVAVRVQGLVTSGVYPDMDTAVSDLVRMALQGRRDRVYPQVEPLPPPVRNPGEDRPIDIHPGDVNWV